MTRFIFIALIGVVLSGCAHQMAECKGHLFPLNAGQWEPAPADLKE